MVRRAVQDPLEREGGWGVRNDRFLVEVYGVVVPGVFSRVSGSLGLEQGVVGAGSVVTSRGITNSHIGLESTYRCFSVRTVDVSETCPGQVARSGDGPFDRHHIVPRHGIAVVWVVGGSP